MTYHPHDNCLCGETPLISFSSGPEHRQHAASSDWRGLWNGKLGCAQADLYSGSLTWNQASRILLCIE